jgi:hypothetical protein
MITKLFNKIRLSYNYNKLIWIIIIIGIILRLVQYLYNRSLWMDEAMLSLNIIDRSFYQLLQPLDYNQGAPIGFLILKKLCIVLFNNSEYSLRLLSLIAGILSLIIFYKLAKLCIKPKAVLIGVSLFAFSRPLIYYSSEVKQYSIDVLISLFIIFYALMVIRSKQLSASLTLFFGVLGAIAIWFSHSSVFTLSGVGITLVLSALIKKEWAKIARLSIIYLLWALSFMAVYLFSLRNLINNAYLINFWGNFFMPFPPSSFADIKWFLAKFFEIFKDPVGFDLVGIASLTFLLGCISIFKHKKELFFVLILPTFLALLASGFHLYPFKGRLLLFIVPAFLLFIGEGSEYIGEKTINNSPVIGITIICLLFLNYPIIENYQFINPFHNEEIKPVIKYVTEHSQINDELYIYYYAIPAYNYYLKRSFTNKTDYIAGRSGKDNWQTYIEDINKLRGKKRVWILFSHVITWNGLDEEKYFLNYLNTVGTKLEEFKSQGASVYAYDFDK